MERNYNKITWEELCEEWDLEMKQLRQKFYVKVGIRDNKGKGVCGFRDYNKCKVTTNIPSGQFCRYCKFFKTIEEVKEIWKD